MLPVKIGETESIFMKNDILSINISEIVKYLVPHCSS